MPPLHLGVLGCGLSAAEAKLWPDETDPSPWRFSALKDLNMLAVTKARKIKKPTRLANSNRHIHTTVALWKMQATWFRSVFCTVRIIIIISNINRNKVNKEEQIVVERTNFSTPLLFLEIMSGSGWNSFLKITKLRSSYIFPPDAFQLSTRLCGLRSLHGIKCLETRAVNITFRV